MSPDMVLGIVAAVLGGVALTSLALMAVAFLLFLALYTFVMAGFRQDDGEVPD